ncbi:UTRA domain-containing protein [Nonomuraea sp. NBC_00507]|uniref:UTRA domain-containing protein n=1 Tax=Nonomuraea sp. NBC_00507 TaxID=2976002 RepID=UPI003FA5DBAD
MAPSAERNRIASYLGTKTKSPVVLRRTLVEHDNEPTEISSTWLPLSVADGTPLTESAELKQGVRRYVEAAAGTTLDHIIEHVTARNPPRKKAGSSTSRARPPCWPFTPLPVTPPGSRGLSSSPCCLGIAMNWRTPTPSVNGGWPEASR